MNFAINIACKVEERVAQIQCHDGRADVDTSTTYQEILEQIVNEDEFAWGAGDIRIGDIILIIDCDTRVPIDCLLDAAISSMSPPILQFFSINRVSFGLRTTTWKE